MWIILYFEASGVLGSIGGIWTTLSKFLTWFAVRATLLQWIEVKVCNRQTGRQTDRQTDRQIDRQTESQIFDKIYIWFFLLMKFSTSLLACLAGDTLFSLYLDANTSYLFLNLLSFKKSNKNWIILKLI